MKQRLFASILTLCMMAVGCSSNEKGSNVEGMSTPTRGSVSEPAIDETARQETTKMPPSDYDLADIFTGLRKQVLELGLDVDESAKTDQSKVIAVLMETGYPESVATLVAIADGTSSLYFSNGGGIIGSGEHQPVQHIAKSFIAMANDYASKGVSVTTYPVPRKKYVRFYITTASAIYTIEALEDDLGHERHEFSPLFFKGHELITSIHEHTHE